MIFTEDGYTASGFSCQCECVMCLNSFYTSVLHLALLCKALTCCGNSRLWPFEIQAVGRDNTSLLMRLSIVELLACLEGVLITIPVPT